MTLEMNALGRQILAAATIAVAAALALGGPGRALPVSAGAAPSPAQAPLPNWLFGPNIVRANAIVQVGGAPHSYRLDRGHIKSVAAGVLTLKERDGSVVPIALATTTKVRVNERNVGVLALRRGMTALVVRDGDAPAELVQASPRALPTAWLATAYFGPNMARVEAIVLAKGVQHDYRVDRGQIKTIAPGVVTLKERDGLIVAIPVSPAARSRLNGRLVAFAALRKGMTATTVRDGEAPADTVLANSLP
jgi:hypothetical protein